MLATAKAQEKTLEFLLSYKDVNDPTEVTQVCALTLIPTLALTQHKHPPARAGAGWLDAAYGRS